MKVPLTLSELKDSNVGTKKAEPVFQSNVDLTLYEPNQVEIKKAEAKDLAWLLARMVNPKDQNVPGWSGFNEKVLEERNIPVTKVGNLPIINAPAHDYDVLWTVIERCQRMTKQLGQTYTVITFDEQLYSKAKILQWSRSEECENLVIMLGGFHTQLNFAKCIGQHMADSGIADIWVDSGVYGEVTAENILKGKCWNKILRAHKLTFEALWRILWHSLADWMQESGKEVDRSIGEIANQIASAFQEKDDQLAQESCVNILVHLELAQNLLSEFDNVNAGNATYVFWRQYMNLVAILLRFTRAIRDGQWDLFLSSLAEMVPWFTAYGHVNYARWSTVFLADAKQLHSWAPCLHNAFLEGDFVVKETNHKFAQLPDDQALEHVNKQGKIAGGLIGITRTESARDRWSLTYNERAQLSRETRTLFGLTDDTGDDDGERCHKDLGASKIKRDEEDVKKLMQSFDKSKVFRNQTESLINIFSGDVATSDIAQSLHDVQMTGKEAHKEFVQNRLIDKKTSFHATMTKVKVKTFSSLYSVKVKTEKQKTTMMKADRELFRRLLVSSESGREVNLECVLESELSPVPLSLATTDGNLRLANKSQLGQILVKDVVKSTIPSSTLKTCTIIDGMSLVQAIGKPKDSDKFGDLADVFTTSVCTHLSGSCTRVDVVLDQYKEASIKSNSRAMRTKGIKPIRRLVDSREVKLPCNWKGFMALDDNKKNLAEFLSNELLKVETKEHCEIVVSGGFSDIKRVGTTSTINTHGPSLSSTQEEADTRIILHVVEAAGSGFERIIICANDTDVLVLLAASVPDLPSQEVWMRSGTCQKRKFIPVHSIDLQRDIQKTLIPFHALTGCDTTSQFSSKVSAWKVFSTGNNASLLTGLGENHLPSPETLANVEAFVCKLYVPSTSVRSIQQLRLSQFRSSKKSLENLPPTQDALLHHIRRAHFQALVWHQACVADPLLPSPLVCGWMDSNSILKPVLMTQSAAPSQYRKLTSCGCTPSGQQCRTRQCSCTKAKLRCIASCAHATIQMERSRELTSQMKGPTADI